MKNIIIRNALASEFNDIAELTIESYREFAGALTPDNWEIMQNNLSKVTQFAQHGKLIVAQESSPETDSIDQVLIGSVVYCPPGTSDSRLFQPEWASIRMLAVSPQQRGRSIGRQLTLECIRCAQQDQAAVIGLHTSELMVAAQSMYEKLGFKQDIELPRSLGIRFWRYILQLSE